MWPHFNSEMLKYFGKGNGALLSAWAWKHLGPYFRGCCNGRLLRVCHVPFRPTFRSLDVGKSDGKMWETFQFAFLNAGEAIQLLEIFLMKCEP